MMIPERNGSQLCKTPSYCTCQTKDNLVNILRTKGTKNNLDYWSFWTGTSLSIAYLFNDIPPHELPLQASFSPIPKI